MDGLMAGRLSVLVFVILMPADSFAASSDDEIRYLISSVGRDGCVFVRNDRSYTRRQAREHLRSKWRLNEQLVESAEDFIEKLASRSVTSGQPYMIQCRGEQPTTAREWFRARLEQFRADSQG